MGRRDESLVLADRIAQRIAQGFRDYLVGLCTGVSLGSETLCEYDVRTEGEKTIIDFTVRPSEGRVPWKNVKFHMEFEHK